MTQERLNVLLQQQIGRIERQILHREQRNSLYSKIRVVYFFVALFSAIYLNDLLPSVLYFFSVVVWVFGFLFLMHLHRKVYRSLDKFGHLLAIKKEHIARMKLDWKNVGFRDVKEVASTHPFADDFNIPGKRGLFHLLDTSVYVGGGQRLMGWITAANPQKETILHRQKLVRELVPLQGFRDKLRVINLFSSVSASPKDWSLEDMFTWLNIPAKKGLSKPLLLLAALSGLNIMLGTLTFLWGISPLFLILSVVLYLILYKNNSQHIVGLFDAAYNMEKILTRFKASLLHVERFKLSQKPELALLLHPFHNEGQKPSQYIKKVESLMSRAALQANQIMWGVVNLTIPWDLYHRWRLEQLKEEFSEQFEVWVDVFYDLEALGSLANFAALNPDYSWPELHEVNVGNLLEAKGLGHPLIGRNAKVENDFQIAAGKDLFLITGSNMAGKSTFLRTVGINLVLAYAGSVVNATSFSTQLFRLFTSINVTDSLGDGLSHFYAEVRRLRQLLTELDKDDELPLYFFVDEIYRGTNNRERFAGSAAFLKEVAGKNGVGMVTTHDLELAELEKEIAQLSNWHFVESIENGKMSFEYKLHSGPCPSTNALEIMRMEGLPVE